MSANTSSSEPFPGGSEPEPHPRSDGPTYGEVVGDGVKWTAGWALRVGIILISLWIVMKALAPMWVAILPVLLALVLSTVLWPPVQWLRAKGLPPALAATIGLVGGFAILVGVAIAIGRSFADQAPELARQASAGVEKVQNWMQGPPLNVRPEDIENGVKSITDQLSDSGSQIAGGVLGGVTSTLSVVVTLVLAVVIAFFMVKDGPRFQPVMRRALGPSAGDHLTELLARMWKTLGGYIRAQALVALVDGFFIGLGLLIMGIPLWLPLAVVTFLGGFIPIVGATVAGALAVLVALVSTGSVVKAIIVLVLVIAVQQIEGNVLQPILQARTMQVHPALIILSIAVGSEMRGIVGAFLAVPAVALLLVLMRYLREQIELRSGAQDLDNLDHLTDAGRDAAQRSALVHRRRVAVEAD